MCNQLTVLFGLLFCVLNVLAGAPSQRWIGVVGSISEATLAEIQTRREVVSIETHAAFSLITCNETTLQLQLLLFRAGLTFYCEDNVEVPVTAVRLVEVDQLAGRQVNGNSLSTTVEATVPPNLDRLDQLSNTPNGQYSPPATGLNVKVYVLDTGVYIQNVEFEGRAFRVTDFKNEAPCTSIAHGSWVAGSVAGKIYGVAKKALIYDMKLPNGDSCTFYTSDAAAALLHLLNYVDPPFIVVMSWSAPQTSAIDYLLNQLAVKGAVLINAAGNEGSSTRPCTTSPGSSGVTYAVGSVGYSMARSSFSNYGNCIDGFALGEDIIAAGMSSTTSLVQGDGTSISAPQMAGVAAVLMQKYSLTTNTAVYSALTTYNQKNVVVNPGSGSPNLFSNFKGNAPTPTPANPVAPPSAAGGRLMLF